MTVAPKRLTFESRDEAKQWIITNQLGRRNLTPEQASYLRGLWYESIKGEQGGDHTPEDDEATGKTFRLDAAQHIAEQTGVTDRTVRNDAKFARAVTKIGEVDPKAKADILAGKSELTKAQITKAADASTGLPSPSPAR